MDSNESKGFNSASELVKSFLKDLGEVRTPTNYPLTGAAWNKYMARLDKSGVTVVEAGEEDANLALEIAGHVGLNLKKPVAYFSVELGKQDVILGLLNAMLDLDRQVLKRVIREPDGINAIAVAASRLLGSDFYIEDSRALTPAEIGKRCESLLYKLENENKQLGLIVIDYLELLYLDRRVDDSYHETSIILSELRALAADFMVPMVVLSRP